MQKIISYINIEILFIIVVVQFLLVFLILLINRISILKLKKKYKKFFDELDKGGIGEQLDKYLEKSDEIKEDYKLIKSKMKNIENISNISIKKVGLIRYSAFKDVGSDMSFSIALLDNNNDGVVLSGLYCRENSTMYAKPIKNNNSSYTLSDEEKNVIEIAKDNYITKIEA
ncbi:MAG: DUF4446 family protein [Clostridiales bacterium]